MSYLIICQTCCLSINSRPVSPQSANVASRSEFEKIFSLETHYYVNRNSYSLWGYLTAFSCVNLMAIKKKNCKVFTFFSLSFKSFHLKGPRLVLQWRWSASSERVYVNLHIFSSTKRLVERRWRGKKTSTPSCLAAPLAAVEAWRCCWNIQHLPMIPSRSAAVLRSCVVLHNLLNI